MKNLFQLYEEKIINKTNKEKFLEEVSKISNRKVINCCINVKKDLLTSKKVITKTIDGGITITKTIIEDIIVREFCFVNEDPLFFKINQDLKFKKQLEEILNRIN
jgi:hypothetical protein